MKARLVFLVARLGAVAGLSRSAPSAAAGAAGRRYNTAKQEWHEREGFRLFRAAGEAALIQVGAKALLATAKGHYEY